MARTEGFAYLFEQARARRQARRSLYVMIIHMPPPLCSAGLRACHVRRNVFASLRMTGYCLSHSRC